MIHVYPTEAGVCNSQSTLDSYALFHDDSITSIYPGIRILLTSMQINFDKINFDKSQSLHSCCKPAWVTNLGGLCLLFSIVMQQTSKCELYGEESCDCGYCNVEGWLTHPPCYSKKVRCLWPLCLFSAGKITYTCRCQGTTVSSLTSKKVSNRKPLSF